MSYTDTPPPTGTIRTVTHDGVATVTIERPDKLNALTPELLDQLGAALDQLRYSDDVRVVVLRSAGERAFCVGADINRFAALGPVAMWQRWTEHGHRVLRALSELPQPTVAVLHGDALGGGLELALAADFRVMRSDARIGLPEVNLGTVPGWAGTERLSRYIGPARAREVVLARRLLDADTALNWGLVTAVSAPGDLHTTVDELVRGLNTAAPVAVRVAKQLLRAAEDGVPSSYTEPLAGALTAATDDLAEGVAAFRERRPAVFVGR